MAKITPKVISALHFGEKKVFVLQEYKEVLHARHAIWRWKKAHPGCDCISKVTEADGCYIFEMLLADHPLEHSTHPKAITPSMAYD